MKTYLKLKIALMSILGIITLFFALLIFHIATAKPVIYDNAYLQISRIDFKEPIDSVKEKEIHSHMKAITGVINPKFYFKQNVLVYYSDNRKTNSNKVYNQLILKGNYNAEKFTIPASLALKSACQVINRNSFSYKFSRGVQRIFN
jgi:hypothetical protein